MSYPTFQDRYGAGAATPATAPQGAGGQVDPQQAMSQENPWTQLLQGQNDMSKKLDPWALDAQSMNPRPAQIGGKT